MISWLPFPYDGIIFWVYFYDFFEEYIDIKFISDCFCSLCFKSIPYECEDIPIREYLEIMMSDHIFLWESIVPKDRSCGIEKFHYASLTSKHDKVILCTQRCKESSIWKKICIISELFLAHWPIIQDFTWLAHKKDFIILYIINKNWIWIDSINIIMTHFRFYLFFMRNRIRSGWCYLLISFRRGSR